MSGPISVTTPDAPPLVPEAAEGPSACPDDDRRKAAQAAVRRSWENTTDRMARTAPGRKAAAEAALRKRTQRYIDRLIAEAPPLTDEQADRLALLLRNRATA